MSWRGWRQRPCVVMCRGCLLATLVLLAACAGRRPPSPRAGSSKTRVHRVRSGETLSGIGRKYGVSYQAIVRLNRIRDPDRIHAGQRLRIPTRSGRRPARVAERKRRVRKRRPRRTAKAPRFQRPVTGWRVTSGFGRRGDDRHDGIDIGAPAGTAVRAAAAGEVAYAGNLPGYGNVIILRHGGGYATVYAHNAWNMVGEGRRVRRGETIATVGRTGRTTGPNLHFEVRRDNIPQDPMRYLPALPER